jgi:hypothetical protein
MFSTGKLKFQTLRFSKHLVDIVGKQKSKIKYGYVSAIQHELLLGKTHMHLNSTNIWEKPSCGPWTVRSHPFLRCQG